MKRARPLLLGAAALALAVLIGGCVLTTAQVFVHYPLANPITITSADDFERVAVDLNTIGDYEKHKKKLKDLADLAILGRFTNLEGSAGGVEIYITPDVTAFDTILDIQRNATLLWGPGAIGATGSTHVVDWAESAKLFKPAGKTILVNAVKGDGVFTLYAIGTPGTFRIRVDKGVVVLVLDAGV